MVIIETAAVINPERIVLTGEIMKYASKLMNQIEDRIYDNIHLVMSSLGDRAAYLGGAVSLFHREMEYCVIHSMY